MTNLLRNPSFEGGWYDQEEGQVPKRWHFWNTGEYLQNPHDKSTDAGFAQPETRVLSRQGLPEHEHSLFILDGDHTFKAFKGFGAWTSSLYQVLDLELGTYRFTVRVFADLVKGYDGNQKVWADDPQGLDGLVRLSNDKPAGPWESLIPGQWNTLSREFIASGETEVSAHFMCPFPLHNSGIFADNWSLERVDDSPPDPDPHPPQRGKPREQYDRVYLLFPQGYGLDWLLAAFEAELETGTRHTLGFSADDAGIGDLDKRRVIAVNPDEIGTGLTEDWYKEHYPGVEYTPLIAHSPEALKFLLIGLDGPPPDPDPEPPPDPPPDPPPTGKMLVGIHDQEAADWTLANGVPLLLAHYSIDGEPQILDFNALAAAGVRVFVRLHWGYAGKGTIPPPDRVGRWILEVAQTIQLSRGVWGWQICNEINNPTEWPGGYPSPTTRVTPEYYAETYREIWRLVRESGSGARLATSPLDPYNVVAREFGQPGDPAEWARIICERCEMDFISMHAKQQHPGSPAGAVFTDAPLVGRYQNMRSIEDQILWMPDSHLHLPWFLTEANQQRDAGGALGWGNDESAARFVHDTCEYLRGLGTDGVVFYRWHADDWALQNRPAILAAIQEEAAR